MWLCPSPAEGCAGQATKQKESAGTPPPAARIASCPLPAAAGLTAGPLVWFSLSVHAPGKLEPEETSRSRYHQLAKVSQQEKRGGADLPAHTRMCACPTFTWLKILAERSTHLPS